MKIYSLNNLQIIFNRILERFLQTNQDKYYFSFLKRELNKYLTSRNIFLKGKYSSNPETIFKLNNPSQLVIDLYKDLNELKRQISPHLDLEKKSVKIKQLFEYNNFKDLGWQYQVIHFLQKQTNKRLNKFINCFLVHGSFATKDFLEDWSDLDTKVILNDSVFENSFNLNYARKWFRKLSLLCDKIDPLIHHRFSFLTNFDLGYYPSFLFPPVLYDYSLLLNGQAEIDIDLRSDKYEKIQIMKNFVNYFRNKVSNQEYSQNQAHWKNDVARLTLWPCFILQAKGICVYKKYSFEKVKQEFSDIDFGLVDQASQIMKNWFRPNILKYYPNFLFVLLPFRLNQIIVNQYKKHINSRPLQQSQKEIKVFTKNALLFLEKTFSLISKDLKNEN